MRETEKHIKNFAWSVKIYGRENNDNRGLSALSPARPIGRRQYPGAMKGWGVNMIHSHRVFCGSLISDIASAFFHTTLRVRVVLKPEYLFVADAKPFPTNYESFQIFHIFAGSVFRLMKTHFMMLSAKQWPSRSNLKWWRKNIFQIKSRTARTLWWSDMRIRSVRTEKCLNI